MIRLAFRVRPADAEVVLAELMDLAPGGVEETDLGDTIEYAVYGAEGELPALPAVRAVVGDALVEVVSTEVADDWADRWRAFHEPILIKDRLYVRPPWSPAYEGGGAGADSTPTGPGGRGASGGAAAAASDLIVDPGQAFGTGAHATTRLCLEFLVELTDARVASGEPLGPVLDLGCGSGVLGIAASRLGWGPVHGVDHEVASVEATLENARVNGEPMTADRFDLLRDGATAMPGAHGPGGHAAGPGAGADHAAPADGAVGTDSAPLVLANLLRPLLLRVAADGFQGEPPHHLIASGLLVHELDGVAAAFARTGLVEAERRTQGDWAALLLRRG
ncbi:50S ribosomal protein L11 methyltransferase [Patulibacter minatonensis]|uniref:50S ribosomal protein L11 methyltransferase n=1 Tax=Patulibacter minatonensis TaxID=298163 RepID=UPI00047C0F2B|nr:50S ribosomal protein L11 methyltransferase [Patulibacter minatonensis]